MLFEVSDVGPFDTVATSSLLNGQASFQKGEGDYLIRYVPDSESMLLPTYFPQMLSWLHSDTVKVKGPLDLVLYAIQRPPETLGESRPVIIQTDPSRAGLGLLFSREVSLIDDFVFISFRQTDENGLGQVWNLPTGRFKVDLDFPGVIESAKSYNEFQINSEDFSPVKFDAMVEGGEYYFERIVLSTKENREIKVFPNPVNDALNISVEFDYVDVLDMLGRNVITTSESIIDVSGLKSGMYFAFVYYNGRMEKVRFVKR